MEDEDLNSIFDEPDKEDIATLPNAEISQDDNVDAKEELTIQEEYDSILQGEFASDEFLDPLKSMAEWGVLVMDNENSPLGPVNFADVAAASKFDRSTGLLNVDNFKNPYQRSRAILLNNRIIKQQEEQQALIAPFVKVAAPGVETFFPDLNTNQVYKWEIGEGGNLEYYYKNNKEEEDWIKQENKKGITYIQSYFEHLTDDEGNLLTSGALDQYYMLKEFSNDIYDTATGNKKAIQAIDKGYLGTPELTEEEAIQGLNPVQLEVAANTSVVYEPQDKELTKDEWSYTGKDLNENQLEALGYNSENSLDIFKIMYGKDSLLEKKLDLESLGINLNAFLNFVETSGAVEGGLNELVDVYYDSTQQEGAYAVESQSYLIKAINTYVERETNINKYFLINNYFKNNLDNPKYVKLIKDINEKQKEGEAGNGVMALDYPDKVNLVNWINYKELYYEVIGDMWKQGGFDNYGQMSSYLEGGTLIDRSQFENYIAENFEEYKNFWNNQSKIRIENRSKGDEGTTWLGEFTKSIKGRLKGWKQGVAQNLSYGADYFDLNVASQWLNQDDEIWKTIVDENLEGYHNLRPEGYYSGKTAVIDNIKYALTDDGQIIDTSDNLLYVVDNNNKESVTKYQNILTQLQNSDKTESFYSLENTRIGMAKVFGYLSMDIIGMFATRKGSNAVGLTKRFNSMLKNRFKFNPKSVNLISSTVNTMAYYGASGTADGYIQTYKLALENDIEPEKAHKLAQGAAWRQGAWYAASSIFVPTSAYNSIPHSVGRFRNKTKQAINAYKNGGHKGFDTYWRGQFAKLNPTSKNVFTKLYDFGRTGLGETAQELSQEWGTKNWINTYINEVAQKKIVSETFTFDEIMNTSIYSFLAGGTAGLLSTGSHVNTNSEEYLENLLYLGKEPTKLETILNKMVTNGELSNEMSLQLMNDIKAVNNQAYKMPTWIKSQNVLEAAQIMEKIDDLNRQKKDFGSNFKGFDNQIKDLQTDLNLLYASDLDIGNQKIANQIGYEYIEGNTATIEKRIAELKASDPNANVDNSIGFGAFVTANGKEYALIDTVKSARKNFFTTGQHEGFHGLLSALVRRDPTAGGRLGAALLKEVRKGINNGTIVLNNNELGIRFQQYVNDTKIGDDVVLEELMPLLSEALTRGGVSIKETMGSKIGDALRRFAASFGINLGFKNGKDVLNLVRDYNKAVESGRGLSRGLLNLAQDKGSFGLGQTSVNLEADTGILDKEGNRINRTGDQNIKESKTPDNIDELGLQYKSDPANADVEGLITQYRNIALKALGYDIGKGTVSPQEAISFVDKYFNSIMKNWDPSKGKLSTHITANIKPKRQAFYESEIGVKAKTTSLDALSEKGVSPETTEQKDFDSPSLQGKARPKVFPNSIRVLSDNITGELRADQIVMLKNDITEAILKVGTDPKKVAQYLAEQTKTKEYRAIIKKALGPFGSQEYIDNVYRLFSNNNFIKSIPVANIKRRFGKLFGIKQTGVTPTIKIENGKRTDFKKQVYNIPAITNAKLQKVKRYFLEGEKRSQSLYSIIGEGIAVEAMNEISTDESFMNDLQNRLEFRDSNLTAEEFMAELEFSFDKRNLEDTSLDSVKLSKDTEVEPITTERYQQLGLIVGDSPKNLLKKEGFTLYSPVSKSGLTDAQKEDRNSATLLSLPDFGLNFFTNTSSFADYNGLFKKRGDINELQELLDAPISAEFIAENQKFFDKALEDGWIVPKGDRFFINKNKLPKYGKYFSESDAKTLKAAENEQRTYATLDVDKRRAKLKDPKFIKLQENKIKLLEKLTKNINKNIRGGRKNGAINKVKFEFWASWFASQTNLGRHPVRALAPIKFMSLSKLPKQAFGEKGTLFTDKEFNKAIYNNYVAEHTLPANNVAKAIIVMIYNNTIDTDFQAVKNNYIQGQLTKVDDNRVNDKSIGEDGYKTKLPRDFWNMNNPNVWVRYLLGDPNIDLNSYIILDDNGDIVTVAAYLGLPLDKAFRNPNSINAQNNLLKKVFKGEITIEEARVELKKSEKVNKISSKQVIINQRTLFPLLNKSGDTESTIKAFSDADKTSALANKYSKEPKGISVFDFDDTLVFSDSKVIVKTLDGKIVKITPAEFALGAEQLLEDGAVFDFSEFNKVVNGRKGPLADLALKRQKKFGSGDIFVLTARPQASANAIKLFLDGIGLNIPLKNITGLENGSPEAKALWVLDKTAQGYNDFYFADDSLPNVQAVKNILDQVDVKSKVQQAKASKEYGLDREFNIIIDKKASRDKYIEQNMQGLDKIDFILSDISGTTDAVSRSNPRYKEHQALRVRKRKIEKLELKYTAAELRAKLKVAKGENKQNLEIAIQEKFKKFPELIEDSEIDIYTGEPISPQSRSSKEIDLDKEFNIIIEQQSGKEWYKTYSPARAKVEGKKANKFEFFIPPSAEDFVGLMYKVLPKGKKGDLAMAWINENLLDPFNKAEQNVISAKMKVANDFKALRKNIDGIPDNLMSEAGYSNFTWSQALRVYIWNMQNDDIPGLSTRDRNALVKLIENNPAMKVFAEKIAFIQQDKPYPAASKNWVGGSITSDIIDGIQKVYRKEALAEWQQNVDIIFSEDNMHKLEALYGSNYVSALKNILARMKSGSNRTESSNPQVDNVIDWVNNSVGTTMFLNRKSALLQLISNINFLNWGDNNILEAGKAFANQPQYWSDVVYLLNSDYLVNRRNGLKINVAESEIAEASKKGGFKGVVAMILNKGFVFTRFADSLAIASGGATFYRNRINKLLTRVNPDTGKLYTKKEAEDSAFNDFYKISEETQQSSRTDRISMQQASGLGRVVLNYANTPMQYARIIKKSTQDLLAGRGDPKTHISKILYYGAVQNLIFNSLQQALFALAFSEDDDEALVDRTAEAKAQNIAFGMLSSLLRGLGYGGALVDTIISVSREIDWGKDGLPVITEDAVFNIFDFSPTIDTKVRKFRNIQKIFKYNRDEIKRRGFSLENPAYYALAQLIDAGFNLPLDRAIRMTMTLMQISDRETKMWQRFALLAGFSSWSLGLPYWGTLTTVGNEAKETEDIKLQYKNDNIKLKRIGYKRIPMTKGKPEGKLNEDYIEVIRPSGDTEYWLVPKMKIK